MSRGYLYADAAERTAALKVGADVLRSVWPQSHATCTVQLGPNRLNATASWQWIGTTIRLHVCLRQSGELVARSKPGRPYSLEWRDWHDFDDVTRRARPSYDCR